MSITIKWLLCSGICIGVFFLVSNLLNKKYNDSLSNLMTIGACLFILFSNADSDSLCMMGPKESVASEEKCLIEGERQSDSGDFTQLGTVESQLSIQETKAAELEFSVKDCERAASFTQNFSIGAAAAAIPTSPISQVASGSAVVSQGLSNSFSASAIDASRALETTKQTIFTLKDMEPS